MSRYSSKDSQKPSEESATQNSKGLSVFQQQFAKLTSEIQRKNPEKSRAATTSAAASSQGGFPESSAARSDGSLNASSQNSSASASASLAARFSAAASSKSSSLSQKRPAAAVAAPTNDDFFQQIKESLSQIETQKFQSEYKELEKLIKIFEIFKENIPEIKQKSLQEQKSYKEFFKNKVLEKFQEIKNSGINGAGKDESSDFFQSCEENKDSFIDEIYENPQAIFLNHFKDFVAQTPTYELLSDKKKVEVLKGLVMKSLDLEIPSVEAVSGHESDDFLYDSEVGLSDLSDFDSPESSPPQSPNRSSVRQGSAPQNPTADKMLQSSQHHK